MTFGWAWRWQEDRVTTSHTSRLNTVALSPIIGRYHRLPSRTSCEYFGLRASSASGGRAAAGVEWRRGAGCLLSPARRTVGRGGPGRGPGRSGAGRINEHLYSESRFLGHAYTVSLAAQYGPCGAQLDREQVQDRVGRGGVRWRGVE